MAKKQRKRVNISVDPHTYEQLQAVRDRLGFRSACQLVVAFVHILLDRVGGPPKVYDLPEEDGAYIADMFEALGHHEPTPDPDYVPRSRTRKRPNNGKRR